MTDADKAGYAKLCAELCTIAARLNEISTGGFADMEGADADEFAISEALYANLESASECVLKTAEYVQAVMKDGNHVARENPASLGPDDL